jgi:hypothetical protein
LRLSEAALTAVGALLLFGLFLYTSQSYEVVYVPTSSMEPNLPLGSLAVVQLGARPAVGDVAVASIFGEPIIHRVVWINGTSSTLGFMGDNTNSTTVVPFSSLEGVMVFAAPLVGYLPLSFQSSPFLWLLGSAALLLLTAGFSLRGREASRQR